MIRLDVDALACDMAETYGIYDMRSQPLSRVAVFAYGLRGDARIVQVATGTETNAEENIIRMLLAVIADAANVLAWQNTRDGQRGRNRPKSIYSALFEKRNNASENVRAFEDASAFETAWNAAVGG